MQIQGLRSLRPAMNTMSSPSRMTPSPGKVPATTTALAEKAAAFRCGLNKKVLTAAAEADDRGHCCGRPELVPLKDAVPKRARGREHHCAGLLGEDSQRDNEMRASAIDCSLVSSNAVHEQHE